MRNALRCCTICAVVLASCVFPATTSFAADAPALESMSLEELLFMDVNVVTAGRTEQTLSEAPATMYVVTAEDIKNFGATQLQEALTMIPGLNLRRATAASSHIGGIRSIMGFPANKSALLIDGEPWVVAAYNDMMLSVPPVALVDIDRIEILEGPGSSLYGSNAVTGVINVITKKAKDTKGLMATFTGGQYNTYIGAVRYGGSVGKKLDYRVTASYNQRDNFGKIPYAHNDRPTQEMPAENVSMDYRISDNHSLSFTYGAMQATKSECEFEGTGPIDYDRSHVEYANLKYFVNNPSIMIGAFYSNNDYLEGGYTFGKKTMDQTSQIGKLEAQNTLNPIKGNTLVWGADVMQIVADAPMFGGKQIVTTPGVFVDDTQKVTGWLSVNAGARYSKTSNAADPVMVDRVSLMFYPWTNHRFRLTQGTAYRDPGVAEMYFNTRSDLGGGLYYDILGNKDLKPERANSIEASYSGRFGNLGLGANIYVMSVKDFISLKATSFWMPGVSKTVTFANSGEAEIAGSEMEVRYLFTSWLSGLANYTHSYSRVITSPAEKFLTQSPEHMANAQLSAKFKKVTLNLWGNYVSETKWYSPTAWNGGGVAKAYTLANISMGYKLSSKLDVLVAATNLFNTEYNEYPITGVSIGTRVTGTVTYSF